MDTSIASDDQQLVDEFVRLTRDTCGGQSLDHRNLDTSVAQLQATVHQALIKGLWQEIAATGTGGDNDVALLSNMLIGAAAITPTPAYPLAETFAARRALTAAGAREIALSEGLVVAAVGFGLQDDQPAQTLIAPFADLAETVVVLRVEGTGECAVVVYRQRDFTASKLVQPDNTRPLYQLDIVGTGEVVGRVDAPAGVSLRSEMVLFEAADMLGCGDALFIATVKHLTERKQFGRPLASFQALSHRLVDLYVHLETLRSLVVYASWVADSRPAEAPDFALMAKGYAAEHCWFTADEAIQLHGAMGFTWEMGLQHPTGRIIARALSTPSGSECYAEVGAASFARGRMLALIE